MIIIKNMCNLYIVSHKKFNKLTNDRLVIGVGNNNENIEADVCDNKSENISEKNSSFCELTALYWIWKNDDSKIVGLEHYRRYFYHKFLSLFKYKLYSKTSFDNMLKKYDIIIPSKSYIVMNINGVHTKNVIHHYETLHNINDILEVKKIIIEKYPNYVQSFDKVMESKSISLFNMFVGKKELISNYCEWLFNILFELEKRIDISNYDSYQGRIFGFLSERLFNVWLDNQPNIKIKYLPVCNVETSAFKCWLKRVCKCFAFWRK